MITFFLALIVIGFVLWLFNSFVTIDPTIKRLINGVVIFLIIMAIILFVLDFMGWYHFPMKNLKG